MEKVIVFGAGLSGIGAKELLELKGYSVLMVDDKLFLPTKDAIKVIENEEIKFIVKSPGIPWDIEFLKKAKEIGIDIISEIDLAYRYMDKNIKIIAITGTNGKTTTATKLNELLVYSGLNSCLAGNVGFSFAHYVKNGEVFDDFVLELSSYQLENNPEIKPFIACITNLTPDHLSRYTSVEEYYETKFNIFLNQDENDYAIINFDDRTFMEFYKNKFINKIKSNIVSVSKINENADVYVKDGYIYSKIYNGERHQKSIQIIEKSLIPLKGEHNLENLLFIITSALIYGINIDLIKKYILSMKALEHRIEPFYTYKNTIFINDSKATNVESTLKALDSFDNNIILILGGDDKKISNKKLVEKVKEKVSFVYLIGDNSSILAKDLDKIKFLNYSITGDIENTLKNIKNNIDFKENNVVLLSPATSSFCQFNNFEERGNYFKNKVKEIIK